MRLTTLTLTAAIILTMTGCSDMVSLNSFAPENVAVQNPALAGVWSSPNDEDLYVVRAADPAKDKGYSITFIGKDTLPVHFSATLFRVGGAEMLDVTPAADDDAFHLATHTPVRIWVDGKTLKFAFLDSKWLREQARKQLAAQEVNKRLLITAPGDAVARFLLLHGADDRAYEGEPHILHQ